VALYVALPQFTPSDVSHSPDATSTFSLPANETLVALKRSLLRQTPGRHKHLGSIHNLYLSCSSMWFLSGMCSARMLLNPIQSLVGKSPLLFQFNPCLPTYCSHWQSRMAN